jgi:Uma2 family endonuclease
MSVVAHAKLTYAEYLKLETAASERHEFADGERLAMAGGTPEHSAIAANVIGHIRTIVRERPCQVFTSDARLRVEATSLAAYPDAMVVCGPVVRSPADELAIVNPILIVEVSSPTTANWDRGGKFAHYRRIPTLREYLVVASDEALIEHYVLEADSRWVLKDHREGALTLASVGGELPLAEAYLEVALPPPVTPP